MSRPFFFIKKGVEFAAGLAGHPDGKRLLISFGVGDREAWIATVEAGEVRRLLEDAEQLAVRSVRERWRRNSQPSGAKDPAPRH